MIAKRLALTGAILIFVIVSCTKRDSHHVPTQSKDDRIAAQRRQSSRGEVSVLVLREVMRYAETKLRYTASDACVATRQPKYPIRFDAPDAAVLQALQREVSGIMPASDCMLGEEWGRVLHRSTKKPALLVYAEPYIFEREGRAFVLAGWYEHTMSAQRFIFILHVRDGEWRVDDASRLGVV